MLLLVPELASRIWAAKAACVGGIGGWGGAEAATESRALASAMVEPRLGAPPVPAAVRLHGWYLR